MMTESERASKSAGPWFHPRQVLDDEKLQGMSEEAQFTLIKVLCLKAEFDQSLLQTYAIAAQLGCSLADLRRWKAEIVRNGFLDDHWNVINCPWYSPTEPR